jgi:hypothetical protein
MLNKFIEEMKLSSVNDQKNLSTTSHVFFLFISNRDIIKNVRRPKHIWSIQEKPPN